MERQFLVDVMLGKLATYLRMCGYDTRYALEDGIEADETIRTLARKTGRTLLTRDRELASRTANAIRIESREITDQLAELRDHGVEIELPARPERCSVCNGLTARLEPEQHPAHAPDETARVWQCQSCDQYFWKGSHWERVQEIITDLSAEQSS